MRMRSSASSGNDRSSSTRMAISIRSETMSAIRPAQCRGSSRMTSCSCSSNAAPLGSLPLSTSIAARPYQQRAIRRVSDAFEKKERRALLVLATGSGCLVWIWVGFLGVGRTERRAFLSACSTVGPCCAGIGWLVRWWRWLVDRRSG